MNRQEARIRIDRARRILAEMATLTTKEGQTGSMAIRKAEAALYEYIQDVEESVKGEGTS